MPPWTNRCPPRREPRRVYVRNVPANAARRKDVVAAVLPAEGAPSFVCTATPGGGVRRMRMDSYKVHVAAKYAHLV